MVLTSRSGEPLALEGVSATGQLQATPRAWPVQVLALGDWAAACAMSDTLPR